MSHAHVRFTRLSCAALIHCAGALIGVCPAQGQVAPGETVGFPWTGAKGITETVQQIMARAPRPGQPGHPVRPRRARQLLKSPNPASPLVANWPQTGAGPLLPAGELDNPQTVATSFLASTVLESQGITPPDSMGAVGPTQVMVFVNGRVRVFDKTGALGPLNTTGESLFASVGGAAGIVDPNVRYDPITQRWFLCAITDELPGRVAIAVSSGPIITGTSSFTFFQFQPDQVGPTPNPDTGALVDYDGMGLDANAMYIGIDLFNPGYVSSTALVVRKSSITGTGPLVATAFRLIASATVDGPSEPRGVGNDDPGATEGYFIGPSSQFFGKLDIRRIFNPGSTPTISQSIFVTVPATVYPIPTPAQGSVAPLDAIDDRLYYATIRRNRATGVPTLWTAHHFQVSSTGIASNSGGRNGSRWYEIQNLNTTPALRQAGTLFDPATTAPRSYWFPSIVMTAQGHAALGCSFAGTADRIGAATAGRLVSDTLGVTQAPTIITAGMSSYNYDPFGAQRWGDYSASVVDPTDDQTIWTFQEYCNAPNSWGIRVAKLLAPPPATPSACDPAAVPPGATNFTTVITGSSINGSGFFDTGPGLSRAQVSVSGTGVTVNSITLISPTQLSVNLTADPSAPTTGRTITVTNPDGQSIVSATPILGIGSGGPPNDPCTGLAPLFDGNINFSTVNATTDGPVEPNCSLGADPQIYNDIWFVYVASCTGTVTIDLCNSTFDTRIAVYDGVCPAGPGTAIACNDNACGVASRVSWGTILHHTYTIRIGGAPGATGTGFLALSCGPCYANCDSSSIAPTLNVNDFVCFLNRFAAGDSRANCDNSTVLPTLNVGDFSCFLNRFAAGC